MTATYEQLPGRLNVIMNLHDDMSIPHDWPYSLVGYTLTAKIKPNNSDAAADLKTITITTVDLAAGQVTYTCANSIISTLPLSAIFTRTSTRK